MAGHTGVSVCSVVTPELPDLCTCTDNGLIAGVVVCKQVALERTFESACERVSVFPPIWCLAETVGAATDGWICRRRIHREGRDQPVHQCLRRAILRQQPARVPRRAEVRDRAIAYPTTADKRYRGSQVRGGASNDRPTAPAARHRHSRLVTLDTYTDRRMFTTMRVGMCARAHMTKEWQAS